MDGQVQAALTSVRARYVDLAKRDIVAAISQFPDIHPSVDSYVFNDGSRKQVVTLNGTIPVSYRANTYNIPICAYLLDSHPYYPPICHVRPTADMVIRPNKHVDNSGKVYLPYLHEWRHPESDLSGLFQVMAIVFGEHCPVFSRSPSTPSNLANYRSQSSSSSFGSNTTPYPASSPYGMPTPPSGAGGAATPPYPNRPLFPPYPPQPPAPTTTASSSYTNSPPYNYPSSNQSIYPPPPANTGTIQPEHIRLSLISAVEDKLRSKLGDSIGTAFAELQSIKKTREDLTNGEAKLKSMLSALQQERDNIDSALIAYREFIDYADKTIEQCKDKEQLEIDEAIDTTAPLYRQLLSCYVEDNAIEDTVYYLGQSLKRGGVDLETYLRHVRTLSRHQFMLRATMQRCRRVAGLDA